MNRPDKAGEPSMDEILASIRQIIADDPAPDRSGLSVEPNPLVPQSAAKSGAAAEAPPGPMVNRLSDVLKSGPLPPTSPLGSKRPFSFDNDLADMFDEPAANGAPVPTPKPDLRVPLELSSSVSKPAPQPSAVEPAPASAAPSAFPSSNGAAALPPQLAPTQPSLPPLPFGAAVPKPAEPVMPPPPRSFGFPPLRKQGFYPPQPKVTPELPPIPAAAEPVSPATPAADDGDSLDKAIERLSGLGAVVPGQAVTNPVADPFAARAFSSPVEPSAAVEAKAVELPVIDPLPAAPDKSGAAGPTSVPNGSAPSFAPQPVPAQPETLLQDQPPMASTARSSAPVGIEPAFGASPERTPNPAQALDALAQGLAASAAASAVSAASAAASQPLIALTPVIEPRAQSSAGNGGQSAPARTLEDAVADMLRPMLQQWVAENMPRIIEKALRVEVARTVKPGPSSGSGS